MTMDRRTLMLATASVALAPTLVAAQDEDEVRRARLFGIYLKAEHALSQLLDAETAFGVARSQSDAVGMSDAASEMFAHSTAFAYWAVVLNDRVLDDPKTTDEANALSTELRDLAVTVYKRLAVVVSTNDMDDLAARLDQSADNFTRLRQIIRTVYVRLRDRFEQ